MESFICGFEKRSYNYDHEASELENTMRERSQRQEPSYRKYMGWGGGVGAGLGALVHGLGTGTGRGALVGAATGGLLGTIMGAGLAANESVDIAEAKDVMQMTDEARGNKLRSMAREQERQELLDAVHTNTDVNTTRAYIPLGGYRRGY